MTRRYTKRKGDYSGEKNNNAKLSSTQVARARRLSRQGMNSSQIAKKMGVDSSTIRKILNSESWKNKGNK